MIVPLLRGNRAVPIDNEEIEKGRRRNWPQLQDPDERRRRELEEKEKDPEYQKKLSYFRKQYQKRERRLVAAEAEWKTTRRQIVIIASATAAIILVFLAVRMVAGIVFRNTTQELIVELQGHVNAGNRYAQFAHPVQTWASWRSAWMRGEADAIARTYSSRMAAREMGMLPESTYILNLQGRIRRGEMVTLRDLAVNFTNPEFLRRPSRNPRDRELCVLVTRQIAVEGVLGGPRDWVLALSWDEKQREWRVEDVRGIESWNPAWSSATMIEASRLPASGPTEP